MAAIPVCPGCGVIAPTAQTQCALCGTGFGAAAPFAAGGAGDVMFARVRLDVTCRACGAETPVALTLQPDFECASCKGRQAVPSEHWTAALQFAHAAADLCKGRGPVMSQNAYDGVGNTRAFADRRVESVHVQASPGHALCPACRVPLEVHRAEDGRWVASCARCSASLVAALPARADFVAPMLRGVIPHRQHGDVVAITCPSCGGALQVVPGADFATCQYCGTSSRVEQRSAPEAEWVLLEGQSAERRRLEELAARQKQKPAAPAKYDRWAAYDEISAEEEEDCKLAEAADNRELIATFVTVGVFIVLGLVVFAMVSC